MKRQKIWAMVGVFAVAASCSLSTSAFADPGTGAGEEPRTDRGIALDELFDSILNKATPAPKHNSPERGAPAVSVPKKNNLTVRPKAQPKPAVVATTKAPAISVPKPPVKQQPVYKPVSESEIQLAVSSGGGKIETPVITAALNKPGYMPKYKSGEKMTVTLRAQQDCNVLVFDYDAKGTLTQLYPNEYENNGTMRAGQEIEIGGPSSKYTLDIEGKGMERIFVYAYPTTDGPITVAMNPVANTPFRSVEISPDQYKRLVKNSKMYFGTDRSVKVTPKAGVTAVQNASAENERQPNKLELTFQIDK
jgi:hypothetical protein